MRNKNVRTLSVTIFFFIFFSLPVFANDVRIAVASNFRHAMVSLVQEFERQSTHRVIISYASTGKHYAQIKNGAPFDIFFAADTDRPMLLEQEGIALTNSHYSYAFGKLAVWSTKKNLVDDEILLGGQFRYLAIANERLAPYGVAASQVLERLGLSDKLEEKLVRGENINQAFQFVKSGNAQLGFVAYSQLINSDDINLGSYWLVPQDLYDPIEQQLVVLHESDASKDFLAFIKSPEGQSIISKSGYYDISTVSQGIEPL